jgi:hypothetical protein
MGDFIFGFVQLGSVFGRGRAGAVAGTPAMAAALGQCLGDRAQPLTAAALRARR